MKATRKFLLISSIASLISVTALADCVSLCYGPEDLKTSVNCDVNNVTVLAKSAEDCKAVNGTVVKSYQEGMNK